MDAWFLSKREVFRPWLRFLPLNPIAVACSNPIDFRVLLRPRGNVFQPMAFHLVVGVKEANPFAFCNVERGVARRAHAGIVLMYGPDARIPSGVFVENGTRTIRRSVIHAKCLPVRERLRQHRIQTLAEVGLGVVDGNNDGEKGRHGSKSITKALERQTKCVGRCSGSIFISMVCSAIQTRSGRRFCLGKEPLH